MTKYKPRFRGPKEASPAVMQRRAPKDGVETDNPHQRLMRQLDYYPTPPWGGRVGAELVLRLHPEARRVKEPACGEGHIAGPLTEYFPEVIASDIYPHGYGEVSDFTMDPHAHGEVDWIITNPPFKHALEFWDQAMKVATHGVALLGRIAFIESIERYRIMDQLTVLAPFSERLPMTLGEWDPEAQSATCYAWFLWAGPELRRNDPDPLVWMIPPGTRDRLWRADDERRYGVQRPMPLFDGPPPLIEGPSS